MFSYSEFEKTLLPGNYALTKSMELTRVQTSGTLWYTKKYLVLYYYVFLSKEIQTNEYVENVIKAFDIYIDSMDEKIKTKAKEFFYPDDEWRNFKSEKFMRFMQFANKTDFDNASERSSYYQNAKKCYFALLMGTGGQAGVKEKVITSIKNESVTYSNKSMQTIILNATADVCYEEANEQEKFYKGDVARIISERASKEIKNLATTKRVSRKDVLDIIAQYPLSADYPGKYGSTTLVSPQYPGVESDCFASVRNERQILYYYGYFHSKSSGASDTEASSLTPIGEISINANYNEFLAIWEHQKIKMISQPPTAEINNVPSSVNDAEKFGISYKPYMDIIDYIADNGRMSLEQYKYIVSRRKHYYTDVEWDSNQIEITKYISLLKNKIEGFGRARDKADEDGRKELLKYILGIRCDMPMDENENTFNICCFKNSEVILKNKKELEIVSKIYKSANEYKIEKYNDLFEECEKDLKERYVSTGKGRQQEVARRTKLHWDLYNIYPDRFILDSVAIAMACISLKIEDVNSATKESITSVIEYIKTNLKTLYKEIGIKTDAQIRNEITMALASMKAHDYKKYVEVETDNTEVLGQYKEESAADLMVKINEISEMAVVSMTTERSRNTRLIGLLKSYYMALFMQNNTLKCESCGNETFITKAGEPYVEFHHLIPFNIAYGPDHYLNLFALCPVCHRKIHFLKEEEKRTTYVNLDNNNYLRKHFVERLSELNLISLLKTYHLDYLLDDNAITQEEYDELYSQLAA